MYEGVFLAVVFIPLPINKQRELSQFNIVIMY